MVDHASNLRDAAAAAATRRHGLVALAAFTLSLLVSLLPGMWSGGSSPGPALAGGVGMLLWAVAFFFSVRAWRELRHIDTPSSMTRVLGHLPIIVMAATVLALALATITAGGSAESGASLTSTEN